MTLRVSGLLFRNSVVYLISFDMSNLWFFAVWMITSIYFDCWVIDVLFSVFVICCDGLFICFDLWLGILILLICLRFGCWFGLLFGLFWF